MTEPRRIGTISLSEIDARIHSSDENRKHPVENILTKARETFRGTNLDEKGTGLLNRRAFGDHYEGWIQENDEQWFAVVIIDLENFKVINDTYGHPTGDELINVIADMMQGCFKRRDEAIARWGGDEFALFLPMRDIQNALAESDEDDPKIFEEKVKDYITKSLNYARDTIQKDDSRLRLLQQTGWSVGVTICSTDTAKEKGYDAIIAESDKKMYVDKADHKAAKAARDQVNGTSDHVVI